MGRPLRVNRCSSSAAPSERSPYPSLLMPGTSPPKPHLARYGFATILSRHSSYAGFFIHFLQKGTKETKHPAVEYCRNLTSFSLLPSVKNEHDLPPRHASPSLCRFLSRQKHRHGCDEKARAGFIRTDNKPRTERYARYTPHRRGARRSALPRFDPTQYTYSPDPD